uniref:Uncharacterized protein n=1 Tax=Romanomermis culicivorax TaxID=13658 RepID=A0A915IPY9_ROMCU
MMKECEIQPKWEHEEQEFKDKIAKMKEYMAQMEGKLQHQKQQANRMQVFVQEEMQAEPPSLMKVGEDVDIDKVHIGEDVIDMPV